MLNTVNINKYSPYKLKPFGALSFKSVKEYRDQKKN